MAGFKLLYVKYAVAAVASVIINLGIQRMVFFTDFGVYTFGFALGAGTLFGLVTKYVLDVIWVFEKDARSLVAFQQGSRYVAVGGATTLVFWLCESVGWWLSSDHTVREVFALVGLVIGYVIKLKLDQRLVFGHD